MRNNWCGVWLIVAVVVLFNLVRHMLRGDWAYVLVVLAIVLVVVMGSVLLVVFEALKRGRGGGGLARAGWNDWPAAWERRKKEEQRQREERRRLRRFGDRKTFGDESGKATTTQRQAVTDSEKLSRYELPLLQSEQELADWLGITLGRLRWFTHDKPADKVWHYVRYTAPKRSGGTRTILAPKRQLKELQRKVLREILGRVPVSSSSHGFVPERSIVSNAQPHVGQQLIVNMDLKDFFPSITYPRVRGLFISLGYSYAVGGTLAMLCTEHDREEYTHKGKRLFVSLDKRALVQGAPTSPAIANLIAWKLDRRLHGLAQSRGFNYTRYADDLTFSSPEIAEVGQLIGAAASIVDDEDFEVNGGKTRISRQSTRQMVTGVVVNDTMGTPRRLRRRLRAILHNAQKTGLEAQNREGRPNFRAHLNGVIGHVHNANPTQAVRERQVLRELDE